MRKIVLLLALVFFCIFSLILLSCSCSVNSITDGIEGVVWERIFEREGTGNCVQQTADGGYIIVVGGCRLIKTDSDGNVLWTNDFDETGCDTCGFYVQQTADGGYIVLGMEDVVGVQGFHNFDVKLGKDICLIKTDAAGNEIWHKTFGQGKWEVGYYVQQTLDGGYIIAGDIRSCGADDWDIWLIKTDADGNELWNRTFGGEESDVGYCAQQTSDGGYILVGATVSYGVNYLDIWLIKTDADGNEVWNKPFDRTEYDVGNYVQQTTDGGYIIEGTIGDYYDHSSDIWLIKTDSDGNEIWNKVLGGTDSDIGRCVQQTADGGYIIVGETVVEELSKDDIFLVKLSASGDISWQLQFGGPESDKASFVIQTTDGGYVITGRIVEKVSGSSCAAFDRPPYYYHLFLVKLTHDD